MNNGVYDNIFVDCKAQKLCEQIEGDIKLSFFLLTMPSEFN